MKRLAAIALVLLGGCAGFQPGDRWPEGLPPQDYFLEAYRQDAANQELQSLPEYLDWIVQFYEGSLIMPMGWNDLTPSVLINLDEQQRALMARRREELGALISAEWAKDNSVRVIDTDMLSLWGSVMENALDPADRLEAVELISLDVRRILDGRLISPAITPERYEAMLGIPLDNGWEF